MKKTERTERKPGQERNRIGERIRDPGGDREEILYPEGWTGAAPYPETEEDPLGLGVEVRGGPDSGPEHPDRSAGSPDRDAEDADREAEDPEEPDGGPEEGGPDAAAGEPDAAARADPDAAAELAADPANRTGSPDAAEGLYPAGGIRAFSRELRELMKQWPDLREMPREVMEAYGRGESLAAAYAGYRAREDSRTAAALRKENAALRRELAALRRAPVRGGVTGGGARQEPEDLFLRGFHS